MFYDRSTCIKLADGIYVFKNYLSKDSINKVKERLASLTENAVYDKTLIDWYRDKMTPELIELFPIWEQLSELLAPEYVIHPTRNITITKPGDGGMFAHSDSPGRDMEEELSQLDTWTTCCVLEYGVIAYFGEFEGGEVYYGNFNPDGTLKDGPGDVNNCLEYKPEEGDIVIHGATDKWTHGVREITSGTRYAYSNFCLLAKDNPGTFFNYGSTEYYMQIGDKSEEKLQQWNRPVIENDYIEVIRQRVLEGRYQLDDKNWYQYSESDLI